MAKKKTKVDGRKGNSGRPSLRSIDRRQIRNVVKTNRAEQERLTKNAKAAGYDSVVVFLRELGLGEISEI